MDMKSFSLEGTVAWVTGASYGIGMAYSFSIYYMFLFITHPNFQLSTPLVLLEKLMPSLITVRLSIAKGAA